MKDKTQTTNGIYVRAAEIREQRHRLARFIGAWPRRVLSLSLGAALVWSAAGCHRTAQVHAAQTGADPANGNFAPVNGPEPAQGQSYQNESQQQAQDYGQQPAAPIVRQPPSGGSQPGYDNSQPAYDNGQPGYVDNGQTGSYDDQDAQDVLEADLSEEEASEPPPPLPDYEQPPCPNPDYIWTPGYWAWGPVGYYWVPGVWVAAPYAGALWTPGYWGLMGGVYRFHHGFWGRHIGFYGGVDYGYGYVGHGYYGGYWNNGRFFYNTAVTRVNMNVVRNVYVHNVVINNTVINHRMINRTSYVGGPGGLPSRPRPAEVAAMREQRFGPMQSQLRVRQDAARNRQQFFQQNHGRPAVVVDTRPIAADHRMSALPQVGAQRRNGAGDHGFQQQNQQFAPPQQPSAGQVFSEGRVTRGQPGGVTTPQARPQGSQPQRPQGGESSPGRRQIQGGQPAQPQQARPQPSQPQGLRPQQGASPQPQAQPNQPQPQFRRGPERSQSRPQPQQQQPQRPQPQQQTRPQAQPQIRPQPQVRPAEQPRAQTQPRQGPAPRPQQGSQEERPHR